MKKINNYFLVAALIATSFVFGCKDKDKDEATPASNGSATISGIIKFDFNTANDTVAGGTTFPTAGPATYEALPTGIVLTATINTADLVLNPDPNVNYPNKEYRTTVDATTGAYSFTIDANENPVNVNIKTGQFRHDKTVASGTNFRSSTTTNVIYAEQTVANTTVVNGDVKIIDAQF